MSTKTSCPPFAWPDSASIFDLPMGRSPSLRSIRPCSASKRQPRADAKKAAAPKATAAAPKAAPKATAAAPKAADAAAAAAADKPLVAVKEHGNPTDEEWEEISKIGQEGVDSIFGENSLTVVVAIEVLFHD